MNTTRLRQGVLAIVTLLSAGCATHQEATASGAPLARQITTSDHCGLSAPGLLHLSEAEELEALGQLPAQNLNLSALKALDFSQEHLVIVALGQKSTAGYGVTLAASQIIDDELQLAVHLRQPAPDSMVAQVLTTPCTVLAVTATGWKRVSAQGVGMQTLSRDR